MAFLTITTGGMEGKRVDITQDQITIGRAADNSIALDAPATSSHHCVIVRSGRKFTLKDLDSTNGTGLNGVAIREARLKPKDLITAGGIELVFDGEDVDVDKSVAQEAMGPSDTVRIAPFTPPSAIMRPPSFGTRKDTKRTWMFLIIIFSVLVLLALGYFLVKLFAATN